MLNSQKIDHEANAVIKYTESYKACIVRIVKQNKRISMRDVADGQESED